ncbi:MAG TPA: D-alanyl-D-alanine carboxypeptidase family protein [Candidatus Saccharibacteria bacterium]|nr:D-alanyl-D-alanine carboxypeptidase family protein [Candidatus Saccharibacteria bacterium]HMR38374.1 D-alanyl-D-alanine carboxypeptidase family protein [Candidatus Saccharibacteria bacterium]
MRIRKSTNHLALFIAIVVVFVITIGVIALISHQFSSEKSKKKAPEVAQEAPVQKAVEPATNKLELPGAIPIEKMTGDYTADDHIWRLVNKSHPLTNSNYRPAELTLFAEHSRTDKSNDERSIRSDIAPYAEQLFADAKKEGFDLIIGSGFRSRDLQNLYYTNYSNTYGQEAADTFSTKPGYSEHQTGLVMDLSTRDMKCYLEECFGDTPAGKWLATHAHVYGFILRYPKDKNGITDFIYEPWHFRFVGKNLATALYESGLTLDEAWPYMTKES